MLSAPSALFFGALLLSSPSAASGQESARSTPPEPRLEWYQEHVALKEDSLFQGLEWQFIGPTNISGRVTDVAVVTPRGASYVIYAAAASGGLWRTVNEGTTWEPVFEHGPSTSLGDVTLAPSDPEIVWIGTGEANIFRSSMAGAGVYKSTDGGDSWEHMGLAGTHTIPRIIVHPTDPDTVWVAASGHEWTDNEERGVYKTTDGGQSWEKVLDRGPKTGAIDLVMHPTDSQTLWAATWQRIRRKWNDPRNEEGYRGSAIFKTTDGGASWKKITKGLPKARWRGRIGIDVARSNPDVLYAFIDNYEPAGDADEGETDSYGRGREGLIKGATVYRSDDGGGSWRQVSENDRYMTRLSATYGWVFGQIRVDPTDEDRIYVMGLSLNVSEDGGQSFRRLGGMHGDHHGLWIDPDNPSYLVNANDGGLSVSYDRGEHWRSFTDNLPAVQFFNVALDMDEPFHAYGSIQDHGSRRGVVDLSRGRDRIPAVEWEDAPGGEGSSHAIDPTDPDIVYSAGFYGSISRTDLGSGEREQIVPRAGEDEPPLRGQWVAPFIISPHNPRIIYHGMNHLFRSMDRGEVWDRISPDLTYDDPERSGDIPFQTLFAISESPLEFGLIYAGTDDGRAHVTQDGGRSWMEVTRGLAHGKWISRIVASAFDRGTVYLSQNGKRDDDFVAYLWKSTDGGLSWQDISGNIPCGPVNVVREDPKNPDVLYVGTDLGVYVTVDGGRRWEALCGDLPTTFVHDLAVHPRDDVLVAATHGRGMYALDVRPIQGLDREALEEDVHLLPLAEARLPQSRWDRGSPATIRFFLKKAGKVKVVLLDAKKKRVRKLVHEGTRGLNAVRWDLRSEAQGEEEEAPRVEAGTYQVRVKAGKAAAPGELVVR